MDAAEPGDFDLVTLAPGACSDLVAALAEAGLPSEDLNRPENLFFRIERHGAAEGYAGLEIHGEAAILRSVVVRADARGQGIGRRLVAATLARAAAGRVRSVYLLTTTAAEFFAKLGFQPVPRDSVPAAIAAAPEFARLCPASAVCMVLSLGGRGDSL